MGICRKLAAFVVFLLYYITIYITIFANYFRVVELLTLLSVFNQSSSSHWSVISNKSFNLVTRLWSLIFLIMWSSLLSLHPSATDLWHCSLKENFTVFTFVTACYSGSNDHWDIFFRWSERSLSGDAPGSSFGHRVDALQLCHRQTGRHDPRGLFVTSSWLLCRWTGRHHSLPEGGYLHIQHHGRLLLLILLWMLFWTFKNF